MFELIFKGLGVNLVDNETKKDLLYLSISSSVVWQERLDDYKPFKTVSIKENANLEQRYKKLGLASHVTTLGKDTFSQAEMGVSKSPSAQYK